MTNETKHALVLGGGGSRGSYTIGAIATLLEQKKSYSLVTGISIGAIVGGIYAMQKPFDFSKFIASFSSSDVADNLFRFPERNAVLKTKPKNFGDYIAQFQKDGPSVAPLHAMYEKIFDFEAFKNSDVDYMCLAADLSENKPAIFAKKDMKTKEQAIQCMLASAAYFPAFSYVSIDGKYYADGGYLNSTLGAQADKLGYDDLTVIALIDPYDKLSYVESKTSLLIRPILKLSYFLDFDKDVMVRQIEQGRLEALKFMNLAPGYIYTFYPEDAIIFKGLSKTAVSILERNHVTFTDDMLINGITELIGYRPGELHNEYMKNYQIGLLLECLALIAGITPYKRYHLMPFLKELLEKLRSFEIEIKPSDANSPLIMDRYGACDLLAFFYNGFKANDGKLPPEFDLVKKKFEALYYLAIAWYILDKFSLVINLFAL